VGARAGRASVGDAAAERAAEAEAARAHGPLWMRLDDGDASALTDACAQFLAALSLLADKLPLAPAQQRLLTALPDFVLRETLADLRPHLEYIGDILNIDAETWDERTFLAPGPAPLNAYVRDMLREDYDDGLVGFGVELVRERARFAMSENASFLLYMKGVHNNPVAAARALGVTRVVALESKYLPQWRWESALRGWVHEAVRAQRIATALPGFERQLLLQLKLAKDEGDDWSDNAR
jgi:hypothetical protein